MSNFSEAEEMLTLSPILVGGVEEEEDCAREASSTVMALRTDSEIEGEGRVTSGLTDGGGGVAILSSRGENISN